MQSDFFKRKIISTFVFRTIGSQTLDIPFVVSIFGLEFRYLLKKNHELYEELKRLGD
jgi:hypothetical protein